MKITIIGGGPAGLYFAILMKQRHPAADIRLLERDGAGDTFGWGIVFSDQTFSYLEDNDKPSFDRIIAAAEIWDNVDVVLKGDKVTIRGNRFSGIGRLTFLNILHDRCRELGVTLNFHHSVAEGKAVVEEARDCDLLVGADGANSLVRRSFAEAFQPTVDLRKNRYIWLGTRQLFHGLTLTFREAAAGVFIAHSYKFSPTTSTFIVECDEATWQRAGFERMSEAATCRYLEEVFKDDLGGHELLTNNFVRWLNFPLIKNARWHHENVVLLGDALHTAHFSIGSGTKLALEDAIALAACFPAGDGAASAVEREFDKHAVTTIVARALASFEQSRKPVIDAYQEAAFSSLLLFENAADEMQQDVVPFAYKMMTRSKRIDYEKLKRRDPQFIAAYDHWLATQQDIEEQV